VPVRILLPALSVKQENIERDGVSLMHLSNQSDVAARRQPIGISLTPQCDRLGAQLQVGSKLGDEFGN
jgi:hypothetical protein